MATSCCIKNVDLMRFDDVVDLIIVNQRTLVWKRWQTSNEYSIILL